MKSYKIFSIFVGLFHLGLTANIAIFHVNYISSYKTLMDIIIENIANEHNITLYSLVHEHFPHENVTVKHLDVPLLSTFFTDGLFEILCSKGPEYITNRVITGLNEEFIESIFKNVHIQEMLKMNNTYDLMMTYTVLAEFSFQFAHILNVPMIQIAATIPVLYNNVATGTPPFLTTTHTFHGYLNHDTFFNRVRIYIRNIKLYYKYFMWYIPHLNSITSKYLPEGTPSIEEMNSNTSLLLANTHTAMGHIRPQMPNLVDIGALHCKPPKPLPDDLEHFISGSDEHGIIYLSFGNSIRSKFPEYIKRGILSVIEKLPQRVLWKWNDDINDLPANVKIARWLPQQDILGHNKTRLFVSQGGMFSMQEAAFHGVPVLVIPIAFDQKTNAILAEEMGYSKHIDFCEFTEDEFLFLVQELISNPIYKRNAEKVSRVMKDVPISSTDRVKWWVNYIIRHKGNPPIHQIQNKYWGLEKLDLDIILFLLTTFILTTIFIFYFIYITIKYTSKYLPKIKIKVS